MRETANRNVRYVLKILAFNKLHELRPTVFFLKNRINWGCNSQIYRQDLNCQNLVSGYFSLTSTLITEFGPCVLFRIFLIFFCQISRNSPLEQAKFVLKSASFNSNFLCQKLK